MFKKMRTHYVFVDEDMENLRYFLENTEIEFRITDGPRWNKPLAFASARPFTHFAVGQAGNEGYVQRQSILLHFFGDVDPFYLLATAGLKRDNEAMPEKLSLYHYNRAYMPENTFYNSDPLPVEWLELFETREYFLEKFRRKE